MEAELEKYRRARDILYATSSLKADITQRADSLRIALSTRSAARRLIAAYNFARRRKSISVPSPYEFVLQTMHNQS